MKWMTIIKLFNWVTDIKFGLSLRPNHHTQFSMSKLIIDSVGSPQKAGQLD